MSVIILFTIILNVLSLHCTAECVSDVDQCSNPSQCVHPDSYEGLKATTKTGKPCVSWNLADPMTKANVTHNYCRAPGHGTWKLPSAPYCFVNYAFNDGSYGGEWDHCFPECNRGDAANTILGLTITTLKAEVSMTTNSPPGPCVQQSPEGEECAYNLENECKILNAYRGTRNTTVHDQPCKEWLGRGWAGYLNTETHNFCRSVPGWSPWCWIERNETDSGLYSLVREVGWDYCFPDCPDREAVYQDFYGGEFEDW